MVDPQSKSLLKVPKDNALPDFLQRTFIEHPQPNKAPKSFERDIQMGESEAFLDRGGVFYKRLQTPESDKKPGEFNVDQYLGDFKNNSKCTHCFSRPPTTRRDRVQIRFNDQIFYPNILLVENYKKLDVELIKGFNKIDFVALNQGSAGPNTAEVRVYDDQGRLMMANLWNLATGTKATFIVVKDE